jgi:hypothetical protein
MVADLAGTPSTGLACKTAAREQIPKIKKLLARFDPQLFRQN